MDDTPRRILLAVEPGVLEGALGRLLSTAFPDEVVELGNGDGRGVEGGYAAAVVSDEVPAGARADVVITLPDTRGSAGTGTVRRGEVVDEVRIAGAESLVELLERYVPRLSRS